MIKSLINGIVLKKKIQFFVFIAIASHALVIAFGIFFFIIQGESNAQIGYNHFEISQILRYSMAKIRWILLNAGQLFIGCCFIHLGFSKTLRDKRFSNLLKCTLLLSLVGTPFIYFRIAQSFIGSNMAGGSFYAVIDTNITSIFSSLLYWLLFIKSIRVSGLINLIFFLLIFLIQVKFIMSIYNTPWRNGFTKLFIAIFLLAIVWFLIYMVLPQPKSGGYGTRLPILLVRIGS